MEDQLGPQASRKEEEKEGGEGEEGKDRICSVGKSINSESKYRLWKRAAALAHTLF